MGDAANWGPQATCCVRLGLSGVVLSDDFRYLTYWLLYDFKLKLVREFGQVLRSRFDVLFGIEKWPERVVSAGAMLPGLPGDEVQLILVPLPECFDQCRWATENLFTPEENLEKYIVAPLGKRFEINPGYVGFHCHGCGQVTVRRRYDVVIGWVKSRGGKWRCLACSRAAQQRVCDRAA